MSLIFVLLIGVAAGAVTSIIFGHKFWVVHNVITGIVGAILGMSLGFLASPNYQDRLALTYLSGLFTVIGALLVVLVANVFEPDTSHK
jgi:uncharacterized membrane protein YeaQ/YmgE (transglycosylase-associated protein family)